MITEEQVEEVVGAEVHTHDDHEVGTVKRVVRDEQSGRPVLVEVDTGLLGHDAVVPVVEALLNGTRLTVPYTKEQVQDAPGLEDGQRAVLDHYGVEDPFGGAGATGPTFDD